MGDITIGDFWGIEEVHPNYLKSNGGPFDLNKGISCIIENTNKGKELIKKYGDNIILLPSKLENISKNNTHLLYPVKSPKERKIIFEKYENNGYKGVSRYFKKTCGIKYYLYPIYHKIKRK